MWLESLREILKIVSMIGLIVTGPMMVAVSYKKLKERYPVEVKKYKWVFWVLAVVLSAVFFSLFQIFFPDIPPKPGGILMNR